MFRLVFSLLLVALPQLILGDPHFQDRIIGGHYVNIEDAPYQAEVIVDNKATCSGAIISSDTIITAASCVSTYSRAVEVRVGTNSRDYDGTGVVLPLCDIISHPRYDFWRFDNNLALLKLCDPLQTSSTIKPIILADSVPEDNTWLQVSGWGSTSWFGSFFDRTFFSLPDHLQMVWVSVYNRQQCAEDRSYWLGFWDNGISHLTLCTQYGAGGCSYDTGAPLVKDGKLVGILSEGGCGKKLDVYASVVWFKSWINDNGGVSSATTSSSSSSTATSSSSTTPTSSSTTLSPTPTTTPSTTSLATTDSPSSTTLGSTKGSSTTTLPTTDSPSSTTLSTSSSSTTLGSTESSSTTTLGTTASSTTLRTTDSPSSTTLITTVSTSSTPLSTTGSLSTTTSSSSPTSSLSTTVSSSPTTLSTTKDPFTTTSSSSSESSPDS
ncbi:trypsin delta [Drosophila eugracilis]|uniref:trypsin delta n=1 Tax=Drosophila eugracilis TaxID=29029 RepID=UPI001BD918F9|nr:trypsin delta [Drosophila eugracilis]